MMVRGYEKKKTKEEKKTQEGNETKVCGIGNKRLEEKRTTRQG
jgi:hypothetical protein